MHGMGKKGAWTVAWHGMHGMACMACMAWVKGAWTVARHGMHGMGERCLDGCQGSFGVGLQGGAEKPGQQSGGGGCASQSAVQGEAYVTRPDMPMPMPCPT
eukprot:366549-Chlamydomonas_euryale.AAC.10